MATNYDYIIRKGNLGVGTATPDYKTQITQAGGSSTSISTIASTNYNLVVQNTTDVAGTYAGIGFMNPFDTQGYIGVSQVGTGYGAGGNMLFALRPQGGGTVMTEYMRLLSNGNLLLGTTTDSGYKLDVNGSTVVRGTGNALTVLDTSGTGRNFTFNPSYATSTYGGFFNHSTGNITLGASLGTDNGSSVGIILGAPSGTRTALLQVKGSGTTSATTSLLVQNSSGTSKLKIDDGLNSDFIMYSNQKINGDGIIVQSTNGSTQTPALTLKPLSSAGQGRIWADADRFYLGMTNTNGVNSNNVYLFTIDNRISKFAVTPDGSVTDASFYGKAIWDGGAAMTLRASSAGQSACIFNVENFDASANYFNVGSTGNVGIGTTSPSASLHVAGNTIITGSLSVSLTTTGSSENTLTLGPAPAGGSGEGGQLGLNAAGGSYTSASFIDTWQDQFRILRGPNNGSNAGLMYMNLGTGNTQFIGAVTASAFSGLPNDYLYATRSGSNQTVVSSWANTDIIFNNQAVAKGISYNTSTGVASLTGGKVYRITARLAWNAAAVYTLQYSCYDSSNNQIGPIVNVVQPTSAVNNTSDGTLEFIYAPGSNIDIKIRTTNGCNALSGETVSGFLNTQFIIQQIA